MPTIISAVCGLALLTMPALSEEPPRLAGLWRLSAFFAENIETKARTHTYGERPMGYMGINADGGFDAWAMSDLPRLDSSGPGPVPSIWEIDHSLPLHAAGFRAILYSGRVRPEGSTLSVSIDKAHHVGFYPDPIHVLWNEFTTSTDEVRSFRMQRDESGNEVLRIETAPFAEPNGAGHQIVGTVTWIRSHDWDAIPLR
jgi:hypothetical protein